LYPDENAVIIHGFQHHTERVPIAV
jgi:hypothetical protein